MCIPQIPEEDFVAAVEQLVRLEADWVPSAPGTSLYIRPFIIATTPSLGVHAAHDYIFAIITCPVGAYYAEGINPVKIYVESEGRPRRPGRHRLHQVRRQLRRLHPRRRAGRGERLRPGAVAGRRPPQVYRGSGLHERHVPDRDTVVTPELTGSVLPGITRRVLH